MTDIGPALREARMHAGLDISEVEERTKIRAKYLRALENEEWALLPGTAFTKGFLRTYARLLGLDDRMLVDEYKRQWEEPYDLEQAPVRPTIGGDLREPAWSSGRGRRWAALAATIVILAVLLVLVGHLFGSPSPPPRGGHGSNSSGLGVGVGTTASHGATASLASCSVAPAGCIALRLEPTARVYVCLVGDGRIRIDGKRLDAGGAPATYHARDFILTLGSHSAKLVIDGHRAALPAGRGPLRYEVTQNERRTLAAPAHLDCVA
jgi:cytoskeleton protein RodZ